MDHTAPELPPMMASMHNKSTSEILADLNKVPLFMTTLEENDDIEAFRALAYEGDPLEITINFKERGNECFKEKKWKDAKEFYEKAINILLQELRNRQRDEEIEAITTLERKQETLILEACLVNRAACHLELQNYRSCIQDCGKALQINSQNIKAYYRSSKALLALNRIPEAEDACTRGLAIDSKNTALQSVSTDIAQQSSILAKTNIQRLERENRNRLEAETLNAALLARNIIVRRTKNPPEMEDLRIMLIPNPIDPVSTLSFPTLLLYPLHLESDLIKGFHETQSITDHLDYILPLPWDSDNLYTPSDVEFYIETAKGGLSKVGKRVKLLKILSGTNIEIIDELLKIFVVPKSKSATWITEFKKKKKLNSNSIF